jgi:hypothetical protein
MWYSVLEKEFPYYSKLLDMHAQVPAGRIYAVSKAALPTGLTASEIGVFAQNIYNELDTHFFTVEMAREMLSTPVRDVKLAHEYSIMVSEREYC